MAGAWFKRAIIMQITRCPVCHSRINLEACVQDEAGRELLAKLAKLDTATATALVGYIGLFRSANRDLANDRALRLANEVAQLENWQFLTPAMAETVESMRDKQVRGEAKPLTNHNYLKRVLESVIARGVVQVERVEPRPQPLVKASKSLQGLAVLEGKKS